MATFRRQKVKVYGPNDTFKDSKTEGLERTAQRVHENTVTLPKVPQPTEPGDATLKAIRKKYGLT